MKIIKVYKKIYIYKYVLRFSTIHIMYNLISTTVHIHSMYICKLIKI